MFRKKIFFFYAVTLIAALVTLLAINGGVVHGITRFYQRSMTPSADDRSQQVQEIMADWQDNSGDWERLDRRLKRLDYDLVVSLGNRVIYSGLDRFQSGLYQRVMRGASWPESGTLTVQNEGLLLVGRRVGPFAAVAMPRPDLPKVLGSQRPQAEAVMLSMLVSGVAAIGIIVVLSLAFARYQMKQLMAPVQALTQAARRVEGGDLSTPVGYGGSDEFTAVCAAFDQMQRHLLDEREKTAAYQRARTDLVAGISHDLRTPLTSVKGYLKGMKDGVANTPEKRQQYLEIAYRKSCDMERLLQRLFYFSKLETGEMPIFPTDTDLGDFIAAFARETGEELSAAGGRVELHRAPGPHRVRADQEQLLRVLTNLKENALRYGGMDPPVLTLSVWRQRDRECIRFADHGGGVPEDQLPHLFEQFWRGDQSRSSRGGEGSGLGLYIVRHIIQTHGGDIRAENDGGLVFTIALPCPEPDAATGGEANE